MRWSVFVTLWLFVMPAVAAAETRIDISPSANFSRYKTFQIEVNPPVRYGQVDEDDTITENRFHRVVEYQLRLHGLTATDTDPDLIVRVSRRGGNKPSSWVPPGIHMVGMDRGDMDTAAIGARPIGATCTRHLFRRLDEN